jgi:hypothetical protein
MSDQEIIHKATELLKQISYRSGFQDGLLIGIFLGMIVMAIIFRKQIG